MMHYPTPFQVGPFPYLPRWLGPVALFFGMLLIFGGAPTTYFPELTRDGFEDSEATLPVWFQFSLLSGFVIGAIFAAVGTLRLHGVLWLYVAALFALGRALEAAAQVGFFIRLYVLITEGRWTGNAQERLPKLLASLFVTLAAITIAIHIINRGSVEISSSERSVP